MNRPEQDVMKAREAGVASLVTFSAFLPDFEQLARLNGERVATRALEIVLHKMTTADSITIRLGSVQLVLTIASGDGERLLEWLAHDAIVPTVIRTGRGRSSE